MIRPVEQAKLMLDHRTSTIEKALAEGEGWRFMIKREDGGCDSNDNFSLKRAPW